jgi:hypothetical protein
MSILGCLFLFFKYLLHVCINFLFKNRKLRHNFENLEKIKMKFYFKRIIRRSFQQKRNK